MDAADGRLDAVRRRAVLELVRRELRAAHAAALGAGARPDEVSGLLDERIRLLSADRLLALAASAFASASTSTSARASAGPAPVPRLKSGHCHRDDVEDRRDDPVDLGGIGQ